MNAGKRLGAVAVICLLAIISGGLTPALATDEDPLVQRTVQKAPNLEPVIEHPQQMQQALAKLAALEKKSGKKPNILIFVMDDVGWGDLGCYGGGKAVGADTPTMDLLAQEGLRLTSCYSQPSCSPTRASLLTGRLPIRHGILRPTMYGESGGLTDEVTIAKLLNDSGYVTQAVGKWHVGENTESQPQNVGFDDFYGFLSVSDMYTEWRDPYFYPEVVHNKARTEMVYKSAFNKHLVHAKKGGEIENQEEITIPVLSNLDEKWAQYSIDFIKKMAKSPQPFFLYHCTRGAHFDNYPSEAYKGKSQSKYPYRDVMVELDDILARMVATLKETGQLQNTLIFVTSDNGPEMESWPDSGYTPFRGAKGSTWEGGMRVPGIAYWPGMIKGGRASDGLFCLMDLYTTSVALAGIPDKLPKDRYIDGIDQTSFLLADNGQSDRKAVYFWLENIFSGVRVGEFKIVYAGEDNLTADTHGVGGFSGQVSNYAYAKLFNLYMDPREEHNYFVRKLVYLDYLREISRRHMMTFLQYKPKKQPVLPLTRDH